MQPTTDNHTQMYMTNITNKYVSGVIPTGIQPLQWTHPIIICCLTNQSLATIQI